MSVTAALGFRPAAGHARPAGLRGAGCLVPLHTIRPRRVAAAKAPPPLTAPHQAPPSQEDMLAASLESQLKQQVEKSRGGKLMWKIIFVATGLVCAYFDFQGGDRYGGMAKLAIALVSLLFPFSL